MLPAGMISKENPQPIRIKFKKVGNLQYISHLDLQRTFEKVIVRSGIPAWYTMGFNPHAKMVFGLPLSVGCQSVCEYLDIRITEYMTFNEIKARLKTALTEELDVIEVYEPQMKLTEIGAARYTLTFETAGACAELADKAKKLFESPVMMEKKGKAGVREIDITTMIKSLDVRYDEASDRIIMDAVVSAGQAETLNPEMMVTALRENLGFLSGDILAEHYSIMREEIFNLNGEAFR